MLCVCLAGLRERRADAGQLRGGNGHGHSAEETAAAKLELFGRFDRTHF
jgi:hypothetical protein